MKILLFMFESPISNNKENKKNVAPSPRLYNLALPPLRHPWPKKYFFLKFLD